MTKFKIIVLALATACILAATGMVAVIGAAAIAAGEAALPPALTALAGALGLSVVASRK